MLNNSKSTLARLLAKENIDVVEGEYSTASFDVVNRVLRIPMWKDMGKDVKDLLIGHEVGHALYTPADGWHDAATSVEGIPRAFLNIIEDIRIERMIQKTYPGLVGSFKRGYKVLFDENFFGTADRDLNKYGLPDRINVKAKLNDLVNVDFESKETEVVKQCFSVDTWEEVVEAARALYEFTKNSKPETTQEDNNYEPTVDEPETESQETAESDESENDSIDSKSMDIESNGDLTSEENDSEVEEEVDVTGSDSFDEPSVETDDAFRSNEKELLDKPDESKTVINGISFSDVEQLVVGYKEVFASRDEKAKEVLTHYRIPHPTQESGFKESFSKFMKETDRTVAVMAKEFEMKKAAFRYSRAKVSRSGSLAMDKVHSYKYNDDIFARNLVMADAKNHGMIMYVDYSGSMGDTIGSVLRQVINLATFCKKVSIPFRVMGFTNNHSRRDFSNVKTNIDLRSVALFELVTSDMNRKDFNRAISDLFILSGRDSYERYHYSSEYEQMGGTPLNTVILAAVRIGQQFRAKYNLDRLNTIFLTDGASQEIELQNSWVGYGSTQYVYDSGKRIEIGKRHRETPPLMKYYKEATGSTVIGYYVAERRSHALDFYRRIVGADWFEADTLARLAMRNKSAVVDECPGYDRMFLLKGGKNLDTDNEDFEVKSGAKKGELTRQFKKFTGSKKTNRVLTTKFAEIVA